MKSTQSVELLAPAGGWPQLRTALNAGADAVFFGAGHFNMRARAKNFAVEELAEVVSCCRDAGAKAYLTLNTIVYESELAQLDSVLAAAKQAGVDAVIAADFAVITAAKALRLPVHISTQMSVSNSASLKFFAQMGIRRVVMARECTLEDIVQIKARADLDDLKIEVFGHGAMCVAVSGRCFMSEFEKGRSANRGECAQPCRRGYGIQSERGGEGFSLEKHHVMSPKDLCTLPFLEKLLDAGVNSIKIEGRNRSPDYVHTVISVYRKAIDTYLAKHGTPTFSQAFGRCKSEGLEELKKVYNRGFSEGFYMGKPMGSWTTAPGNQSTHRKDYVGQIIQMDPDGQHVSVRLESEGLSEGTGIFIESPELGFLEITPTGIRLDGKPVKQAEKGSVITLPQKPYMHKGLKFYTLSPR
ncbi:U32 family peptidase [Kiritimatiellaeota bacterium B1221]|nr:U32 family peptidase [Kiritimatiellaeota bacterium B1221]